MVLRLARFFLGGVFVLAGGAKLLAGGQFRSSLPGYGVPAGLVGPIGTIVPAAEMGAGLLALLPACRRAAVRWQAALLALFNLVTVSAVLRGRHPECACFGGLSVNDWSGAMIARNTMLLALAVLASDPA